jgi:hypothetical protein
MASIQSETASRRHGTGHWEGFRPNDATKAIEIGR